MLPHLRLNIDISLSRDGCESFMTGIGVLLKKEG